MTRPPGHAGPQLSLRHTLLVRGGGSFIDSRDGVRIDKWRAGTPERLLVMNDPGGPFNEECGVARQRRARHGGLVADSQRSANTPIRHTFPLRGDCVTGVWSYARTGFPFVGHQDYATNQRSSTRNGRCEPPILWKRPPRQNGRRKPVDAILSR